METSSSIPQRILVLQQNGSGESKIRGILRFGGGRFHVTTSNIDNHLPPLLDDTDAYLPEAIDADLVLDFLKHPDLSQDLAERCTALAIPMIASGKKLRARGVLTPPT